ncbi:hypothetical protein EFO07_12530 [Lactococcus cremoris]|nr:hypothetical protein [Lactococcus cremoris]
MEFRESAFDFQTSQQNRITLFFIVYYFFTDDDIFLILAILFLVLLQSLKIKYKVYNPSCS